MRHFRRGSGLVAGALLALTALAAFAQQRNSNAKSDQPDYERVVDEFIQYDIGAISDPAAVQRIRANFGRLNTDDAVPALVSGLNKATRMRASCPITALAGKIREILKLSNDPEVGTYVLKNLEQRPVPGYTSHIVGVFAAAETQVVRTAGKEYAQQRFEQRVESDQQRLAYVPGLKLTDLAARGGKPNGAVEVVSDAEPRPAAPPARQRRSQQPATEPDVHKLTVAQLAESLDDSSVQSRAIAELYRRAGGNDAAAVAEHSGAVVHALHDGDEATRETAARLLGLIRAEQAVPDLIDSLEDANANVRSAAATALSRITRQLFGPAENASDAETRQAVARWRQWWQQQAGGR